MMIPVTEKKSTRAAFGEALLEIGKSNPKVVALCADLTGSVNMDKFAKQFPERFIHAGVAEQNMIGMAAGMAITGKIPFVGTFAVFATGRVYDIIRQSLAYSKNNVKVCASHAGLTLGEDGATHQMLEDVGLMRGLPNMVVVVPCDANETKKATHAIAEYIGPVYLRFGRVNLPVFTDPNETFTLGKADTLIDGNDATIIACGVMVWQAVQAAEILKTQGINARVINMHTIKPLDNDTILKAARETGALVTAEEHQINNGLGDAVAQVVARNHPVPVEMVAVNDTFGESGAPDELLQKYHLWKDDIVVAVKKAIARK